VRIRKQGEKVILEPVKKSEWPNGFWDVFTQDPQFETPEPLPSKKLAHLKTLGYIAE
jgi:virulence-associated protein VagC